MVFKMTIVSKSLSIVELVQEMADALLAANSDFSDITSGFGDRCLYYTPDSLYIHFKPDWEYGLYFGFVGIRINVSTGWDGVLYEPTGTVYTMYIVVTAHAAYNANPTNLDSEAERDIWWNKKYQCIYYIDAGGLNLWYRNPYITNVDDSRTILFNLEIIPVADREYSDGFSDIFMSVIDYGTAFNASEEDKDYPSLRPFNYVGSANMWQYTTKAYSSAGTGELYIDFPWYYNDPGTFLDPIAQTKRWFVVDEANTDALPLDVVVWDDNGTTRSYLIVDMLTATETGPNYFIGIPFEVV